MRTGGCTVQQALTTEGASVLKYSLSLAKRRGHAQVTPLHVAATLLSSTREATSLFRRACLKSHPLHPNSHPLQCRALELCFNVALNRLPTIPPPSSGPLIPSHPSLSNALIAALKRAQAHQRRGCIEQQQQQHHNQQQQPLLAIKVELEQLIISILDDPSVSRVMREAGFSSTCIKNNLEEDTSSSSTSPSSVFFDTHRGIINQPSFWQTHLLKPSVEQNPPLLSSQKEDIRHVLDVLLGKNKKRTNTVVVGDSVSCTEGLVAELMGKVEKGDVPEELRSVRFIKLQLSALQLKFMSSTDVEMKFSDLRRKVSSLTSERRSVIIYLGDIKWAVDEEEVRGVEGGGYRAVKHVIAELSRLQCEWRSFHGCSVSSRVWLMATASYQTYMRCQSRQPSLEVQWGLQAVAVPSGGLALSLHVPSGLDSRVTTTYQNPVQVWESKPFYRNDEHDKLMCCAECTSNFERESITLKSGYNKDSERKDSASLPFWLQPHKHHNHQEDFLIELRKKWTSFCQRLHHNRHNQIQMYPPLLPSFGTKNHSYGSLHPLLSSNTQFKQSSIFPDSNSFASTEFSSKSSLGLSDLLGRSRNVDAELPVQEQEASKQWTSIAGFDIEHVDDKQDVRTTLALGCSPFSESASRKGLPEGLKIDPQELSRRLKDNIPWQSEAVHAITEALLAKRPCGRGTWLMIQGNDWIGKRRLAMVVADCACGSIDNLVCINAANPETKARTNIKLLMDALQKDANCVVSIEEIDHADASFLKFLSEGFETGNFKDTTGRAVTSASAILILTSISDRAGRSPDSVIEMKLQTEFMAVDSTVVTKELKRKAEPMSPSKLKNPRKAENHLDLNIRAQDPDCKEEEEEEEEEEEDNVLSDLTHETESIELHSSGKFLNSIERCFVLDSCPDHSLRILEYYLSRINRAFDEVRCSEEECGFLAIDRAVLEELVAGSGFFLENLFDNWLKEVFQSCLPTVKKGGKVQLCLEGKVENSMGFMGSCLPNRIQVD